MAQLATARARVELIDGRARFTHLSAGGYVRPRPMTVQGPIARLALVSSYATLLAEDDLRIEIEVGAGVWLELVEPSGTVAYDSYGQKASWSARIDVAEGATLSWRGAPFVVTAGADLRRSTEVHVAAGGRALISELLMLGRTYESGGGPVRTGMRAHWAGSPVLVEDLDLRETEHRSSPGVLGHNRAMASVILLGLRPDQVTGRHETRLAGQGAMARTLAPQAHQAEDALAATWQRWSPLIAPEPFGTLQGRDGAQPGDGAPSRDRKGAGDGARSGGNVSSGQGAGAWSVSDLPAGQPAQARG